MISAIIVTPTNFVVRWSAVYLTISLLNPIDMVHYTIEDDEFEEFDPAHWNKDAMDEETQQQWMENWDEAMDDDFTQNLREELQKSSK